ncbi:unnamed protein product, partial [Candidula unifasciata]
QLAREFMQKHRRVSLATLMKTFKEADDKAEEICPVTTRAELTKRLSSLKIFSPEIPCVSDMHTLWADPAMIACFEKRHTFESDYLASNTEYFLLHIGRICSQDFLPSVQDILHIRWPTLGVQEHQFHVGNFLYRMIDVAGQRSLRKKWIHFFTEVTAVSFFVSLTAVDEVLEEDPTMNSLQDSLQAFNEVSHNQFLEKTDFILFLNKKDLFANKLKSTSLSNSCQECSLTFCLYLQVYLWSLYQRCTFLFVSCFTNCKLLKFHVLVLLFSDIMFSFVFSQVRRFSLLFSNFMFPIVNFTSSIF